MIKIVDGDVVIEDNEKEKLEERFNEICKDLRRQLTNANLGSNTFQKTKDSWDIEKEKCHNQKLR